ncbi:MAG: 30S ribosomal protein S6 [Candidatus Doudnabacteria bacterium]|nr:30S ribosomal protein S6 [Candidatus Doudnabacteria bacterium]
MPRYELCYILAAQVSDDQVPGVTEQIRQFVSDFGGTEINEEQLGKKKLAYPIKKTRNGFYVALTFTMDSRKVNALEAKIRTQTATIIRHLVINVDEHLVRSEKDKVAQSKLTHRPGEEEAAAATPIPTSTPTPTVAVKEVKEEVVEEPQAELVVEEPEAAAEISIEDLDKQIEAALSDEIIK